MVRPLDLQVSIAKAAYASQVQGAQHEAPQAAQNAAAREAAQQQVLDHSRTAPVEPSQEAELHPHDGDPDQRQGRKRKRRPEAEAEEEEPPKAGDGHLDIVV